MQNMFLFNPKKIINPDDSAIAYSEGKILVTNRYTEAVEYEHDLGNNPLGIREHEGFIELGVLLSYQIIDRIQLHRYSRTICRIDRTEAQVYVLLVEHGRQQRVYPLFPPLLLVQNRSILTVGSALPSRN